MFPELLVRWLGHAYLLVSADQQGGIGHVSYARKKMLGSVQSPMVANCLSYPDPWLVKKPAFLAKMLEPRRRYGYTARDKVANVMLIVQPYEMRQAFEIGCEHL